MRPDVKNYFDGFYWYEQRFTLYDVTAIFANAMMEYLSGHKNLTFIKEVSTVIQNQKRVELTPALITVTTGLQKLKPEEKSAEELRNLCEDYMELLLM
jgi:hypothetical protein